MISIPPTMTLKEAMNGGIKSPLDDHVAVWCTPSVVDRLQALSTWTVSREQPKLYKETKWLIAVGGGTLIDHAKLLRSQHPNVKLAALPTLWGSGAEASLIAVCNEDGRKVIRMGPKMRPDLIITHPWFAETLSDEQIRNACGDTWSHALEGFLSPLGGEETRKDLACVIHRMLNLPIDFAPGWFEASALACAGQARTSVGLVHGLAHSLEPLTLWGHAKLCSIFLLPVMRFNQANSTKWPLLKAHDLSDCDIFPILQHFFDERSYATLLPVLRSNWNKVLRDPCSRTNSALVRPADLEFFESFTA